MDMSDTPNVQVLIAALDLLSGIVRGLGPSIRPLLSKTSPPLLPLLATCIHVRKDYARNLISNSSRHSIHFLMCCNPHLC